MLAQITEELDALPTSTSRQDHGQWNTPTQRLLPNRRETIRLLNDADGERHTCRLKRVCAILAWVRQTKMKVFLVPEMTYAVPRLRPLLFDPLPDDVKPSVAVLDRRGPLGTNPRRAAREAAQA